MKEFGVMAYIVGLAIAAYLIIEGLPSVMESIGAWICAIILMVGGSAAFHHKE